MTTEPNESDFDDVTEGTPWKPPTWTDPGVCVCGAVLPPMSGWKNAGSDWSSYVCSTCGRELVDEEEYMAIYDEQVTDG